MSATVLESLRVEGFRLRLYWPEPEDPARPVQAAPRLLVDGDEALPDELREAVKANRDSLKAALLLSDPPEWLAKLFDLYWAGHESPVRLTTPKGVDGQEGFDFGDADEVREESASYPDNLKGGKTEVYMVRLSLKNIAAAVAAEIGTPVRECERLLPEVEEAIGSWEGAA
jgi:hypothetical protein